MADDAALALMRHADDEQVLQGLQDYLKYLDPNGNNGNSQAEARAQQGLPALLVQLLQRTWGGHATAAGAAAAGLQVSVPLASDGSGGRGHVQLPRHQAGRVLLCRLLWELGPLRPPGAKHLLPPMRAAGVLLLLAGVLQVLVGAVDAAGAAAAAAAAVDAAATAALSTHVDAAASAEPPAWPVGEDVGAVAVVRAVDAVMRSAADKDKYDAAAVRQAGEAGVTAALVRLVKAPDCLSKLPDTAAAACSLLAGLTTKLQGGGEAEEVQRSVVQPAVSAVQEAVLGALSGGDEGAAAGAAKCLSIFQCRPSDYSSIAKRFTAVLSSLGSREVSGGGGGGVVSGTAVPPPPLPLHTIGDVVARVLSALRPFAMGDSWTTSSPRLLPGPANALASAGAWEALAATVEAEVQRGVAAAAASPPASVPPVDAAAAGSPGGTSTAGQGCSSGTTSPQYSLAGLLDQVETVGKLWVAARQPYDGNEVRWGDIVMSLAQPRRPFQFHSTALHIPKVKGSSRWKSQERLRCTLFQKIDWGLCCHSYIQLSSTAVLTYII